MFEKLRDFRVLAMSGPTKRGGIELRIPNFQIRPGAEQKASKFRVAACRRLV